MNFNIDKINNLTIDELNNQIKNLSQEGIYYILEPEDVEKYRVILMNTKKNKILETFPLNIWQADSGVWRAYIPDDSRPNKRRLIQGKTRENLEKKILDNYKNTDKADFVFSCYFKNWLTSYKSKEVSPSTIQRFYSDYNKYIKDSNLDNISIDKIKRTTIKDFFNNIINTHSLTRKRINNLKTLFNGVFEYAIDNEDIKSNPMLNLKIHNTNIREELPKECTTEVFNEEEFSCLTSYMYKHYWEYRPMVTLAILLNFQLGLRVGELCAIRKSDIDYDNRKIKIERTEASYRPIKLVNGDLVQEKTVHIIADGHTKNNSSRIIELSDEALAIIHETLELQKKKSLESDYLFCDDNGNHIIRQRINDCLRFYCKKVSLDVKSSHKIRKTVLSRLFSRGFDFEEVMKFAGHRNKSTTINYYLFSMRLKEDNHDRISNALSSNNCPFMNSTKNDKSQPDIKEHKKKRKCH